MGREIILCDFTSPKIKLLDHYPIARRRDLGEAKDSWKEGSYQDWWAVDKLQASFAYSAPRHLKPDWSTFVTFDDPDLHSLDIARSQLSDGQYTLETISQSDLSSVRKDICRISSRGASRNSQINWLTVTEGIAAHYNSLLRALQAILTARNPGWRTTYDRLINDLSMVAATSASNESRCALLFLPSAADNQDLTKSEKLIYEAVQEVLERVCSIGDVLRKIGDETKVLEEVNALVTWLDWPPPQYNCNETCSGTVSPKRSDLVEREF